MRHSHGYVLEYAPGHPAAHFGWVYQHRLVWEGSNGPLSKGWSIHHLNHDKADNRLENLTALPQSRHNGLHMSHDRAVAMGRMSGHSPNTGRPRSTTLAQDKAMTAMRDQGVGLREIAATVLGDAERFSTVHKIVKRTRAHGLHTH